MTAPNPSQLGARPSNGAPSATPQQSLPTAQWPAPHAQVGASVYLTVFAQQQQKMAVQESFRVRLSNIEFLNQDAASEISRFASLYHNLAAQEIANVIIEFIRDVSAPAHRP